MHASPASCIKLCADRLALAPSLDADKRVKLHDQLYVGRHVCMQALVAKQWSQANVSYLTNVAWPDSLLRTLAGRLQSAACW